MNAWHTHPAAEVLRGLSASEAGLGPAAAAERLKFHGLNELQQRRGQRALATLREQFSEFLVLILIAAAFISALLGKGIETAAILAILTLFAVLGFLRLYNVERAVVALQQPAARVRRGGKPREVPARELVPGDIVLLEAGSAVPADLRLLESASLHIQEQALTGEPESVEKTTAEIPIPDLPLGDRRNMAYLGSSVTHGRGSAVVVATGRRTELGRIAALIQDVAAEKTPLKRRLDRLGRVLLGGSGLAAVLALLIGWWNGVALADTFLTIVSLAVAVVPEGLPAVVAATAVLAARRMLRSQAAIRKLSAVETLGAATVICSDKTGTLTENRMTVTVIDAAGDRLNLVENLRRRLPSVTDDECRISSGWDLPLPIRLALAAGALCNNAALIPDAGAGGFHAVGNPAEGALLVAAARCGMLPERLRSAAARTAEVPLDINRKRMTTVHRLADAGPIPDALGVFRGGSHVAFTKGDVDGLLGLTTQVWTENQPEPITDALRDRIRTASAELAQSGVRVLGVSCRVLDAAPPAASAGALERDLTFLGLVGLMDPPRAGVKPAVAACRAAGIRPMMITGDHPLTAVAIARDLGIADRPKLIDGEGFERMGPSDLAESVERVSVYARMSSNDKLRIVAALKQRGHVVVMTGDAAGDAPALRKADIGVSMGITGTDIAKEAAGVVLLDDNFTTMVAAVQAGRVFYANLLRFIRLYLGGNLGKVMVLLAAPLFGMTVALPPLQVLWLNLLIDGLLGLGLGAEPAEADAMRRPPASPGAPVLDRAMRIHIGRAGAIIAGLTLGLGALYFDPARPEDTTWQTMIFAALGFAQIGHALGLRTTGHSILTVATNPLMAVLTLTALVLQLAVIYLPFLDRFFGLTPLSVKDLGMAFGVGALTWAGVQIGKRMQARSSR
ncbi:MAG: cation-translocating P-type ATPase [Hyphomicrobiales bacterium]